MRLANLIEMRSVRRVLAAHDNDCVDFPGKARGRFLTLTRRKADGVEIINIPLINYLLMLKSDLYASMDSQEFLDRESEWSMIFFLSPNLEWIKTYIKINDWTVRINDIGQ